MAHLGVGCESREEVDHLATRARARALPDLGARRRGPRSATGRSSATPTATRSRCRSASRSGTGRRSVVGEIRSVVAVGETRRPRHPLRTRSPRSPGGFHPPYEIAALDPHAQLRQLDRLPDQSLDDAAQLAREPVDLERERDAAGCRGLRVASLRAPRPVALRAVRGFAGAVQRGLPARRARERGGRVGAFAPASARGLPAVFASPNAKSSPESTSRSAISASRLRGARAAGVGGSRSSKSNSPAGRISNSSSSASAAGISIMPEDRGVAVAALAPERPAEVLELRGVLHAGAERRRRALRLGERDLDPADLHDVAVLEHRARGRLARSRTCRSRCPCPRPCIPRACA